MAAMTSSLEVQSVMGSTTTYMVSDHTTLDPHLVVLSHKIPVGNQTVATTSFRVLHGTTDGTGALLPTRSSVEVIVRHPINGQVADRAYALDTAKDIINSTEFAAAVNRQGRF